MVRTTGFDACTRVFVEEWCVCVTLPVCLAPPLTTSLIREEGTVEHTLHRCCHRQTSPDKLDVRELEESLKGGEEAGIVQGSETRPYRTCGPAPCLESLGR